MPTCRVHPSSFSRSFPCSRPPLLYLPFLSACAATTKLPSPNSAKHYPVTTMDTSCATTRRRLLPSASCHVPARCILPQPSRTIHAKLPEMAGFITLRYILSLSALLTLSRHVGLCCSRCRSRSSCATDSFSHPIASCIHGDSACVFLQNLLN
jgi:hypothetical protein